MDERDLRDFHYERLEFLGDAVLDVIANEYLLENFKLDSPGDLSLKKQCIVCNKALSLVLTKIKLQ
jgi:dsRNA-specific ribonuclease